MDGWINRWLYAWMIYPVIQIHIIASVPPCLKSLNSGSSNCLCQREARSKTQVQVHLEGTANQYGVPLTRYRYLMKHFYPDRSAHFQIDHCSTYLRFTEKCDEVANDVYCILWLLQSLSTSKIFLLILPCRHKIPNWLNNFCKHSRDLKDQCQGTVMMFWWPLTKACFLLLFKFFYQSTCVYTYRIKTLTHLWLEGSACKTTRLIWIMTFLYIFR